jgi:hypothetical protein
MSRRQYITSTYLTNYLGSQTLNGDFPTADALIEMAEEMIDGYVGPQRKWFQLDSSFVAGVYTPPDYEPETPVVKELRGRITAVIDASNYKLETWQQQAYQDGFFQTCNIDIIGGTGMGTSYLISASTLTGQITLTNIDGSALTASPIDTTSIYRIYQLGKFPRDRDVFFNTFAQPNTYYKAVPEMVREATAAQCEYINKMGLDFFISADAYMTGEHIGPYSYSRDLKMAGGNIQIAPKAKLLLRGLMNRRGTIII